MSAAAPTLKGKVKTISQFSLIVGTGFAMFSMFFGAGNLIFPIRIGTVVGQDFDMASIGFLITGVLVPLLGLLAVIRSKGSYQTFFDVLGKYGSFVIPFILMLLIGPLGATPRCITVAYGSFLTLFPNMNMYAYTVVAGLIIYYLVHDRGELVGRIGFYLTPILLASLTALIAVAIWNDSIIDEVSPVTPSESLVHGMLEGYQTMDLIATFFFAIILIDYIRGKMGANTSYEQISVVTIKSLLLGGGLLAAVYVAFIYTGALYSTNLQGVDPEQSLSIIAHASMGPYAAPIVTIAFVMACLTTAVALVSSFSEFIFEHVFKEKVSMHACVVGTILVSCALSTLRFAGIVSYLAPIVQAMYPGIIALTILSLLRPFYDFPYTKQFFYILFIANGVYIFWG